VISHSHPDHFGLLERLGASIPVCMGRDSAQILRAASFYTGRKPPRVSDYLANGVSFELGPFRVTPYLVDHSAYDAYALLIEADDSRLFYTGDLRAHGRKPGTFARLLDRPPADVDVLLLEGTSVGRPPSIGLANERELERRYTIRFSETEGAALACYSPQNLDRLVTVYRAALQAGRSLVMDLYAADIATATGNENIPQAEWDRVRVYVPNSQRVQVKRSGEFARIDRRRAQRIFPEELAADPSRWVITFRPSMAAELERAGCLVGARAIWMMWQGYLGQEADRTREIFERLGVPLEVTHASGHAHVRDLQRLASAIAADRVVPIHTASPDLFDSLFDRVQRHSDGEWWEV
jgi:ribonuclease J